MLSYQGFQLTLPLVTASLDLPHAVPQALDEEMALTF